MVATRRCVGWTVAIRQRDRDTQTVLTNAVHAQFLSLYRDRCTVQDANTADGWRRARAIVLVCRAGPVDQRAKARAARNQRSTHTLDESLTLAEENNQGIFEIKSTKSVLRILSYTNI